MAQSNFHGPFFPGRQTKCQKLLDEFGKKTVCPVDDALGISDIPFKITRKAMSAIAREATKARSYSDAALELKIKFGEPISISTVERVTNYVGALMLQVQSKQMENAKTIRIQED